LDKIVRSTSLGLIIKTFALHLEICKKILEHCFEVISTG